MNWDYTRYYAAIHPDTPEHWQQMTERMQRWLLPRLPGDRAARIVDLGCGHGYAIVALQKAGFAQITGLDPDEGQVRVAVQHGLPVEHAPDPMAWLRNRPAAHDVVLLLDVLEHVPRAAQREFLEAIAGGLKPGGRLVLTVPNAAASLASYWRYNDYTHTSGFTTASLDFLLTHAGFSRKTFAEIELLPPGWSVRAWALRFFRLWRRLELVAEFGREGGRAVPVTPNLLAVAQRD